MSVNVFIAPSVQQVIDLHAPVRVEGFGRLAIHDQLKRRALNLYRAYRQNDAAACVEIINHNPDMVTRPANEIFEAELSEDEINNVIAREYGYSSWNNVEALGDKTLDADFEQAVDTLLSGDDEGLAKQLNKNAELTSMRSDFGHQATLLHYLGSNAVEIHRQIVPLNAPRLAERLIEAGADKTATIRAYGKNLTAHELAATSEHPLRAGIQNDLLEALKP